MSHVAADEAGLTALVYGGAILGGGGGGSLESGLEAIRATLDAGVPRILPLSALPGSTILATLSAVGSQNDAAGSALKPVHFSRAIKLFEPFAGCRIGGFIASEVGPRAVTYGLLDSTRTGIPVVDAPANGRAHPLFAMGSLGLHRRLSCKTDTIAVGGRPGTRHYAELAIHANVLKAARIVRKRAAQDGMALAVVRNAVPAAYARRHAAIGGLVYAQRAGRCLLAALPQGINAVLAALSEAMGGRVLATGHIVSTTLAERGGFSLGVITIACQGGFHIKIPVCNEYLAACAGPCVLARFPDLIALFDHVTGLPLSSTCATPFRRISVFAVPRRNLILSSPLRDPQLLAQIQVQIQQATKM